MFTGLVEGTGRVAAREDMAGGMRLRVATPLAATAGVGDSIAHNGVCLTIVGCDAGTIATEIGPETMRVTNLGLLAVGDLVNLERPLRADAHLGGHFVQGHVDTTARIERIVDRGEFWTIRVEAPPVIAPLLIRKGSIALDGISLTVAALESGAFEVMIIPHTWALTNLHRRRVGDLVNLEGDMLGKYVLRFAELAREATSAAGA